MGYSASDAAQNAGDAVRAEAALREAIEMAKKVGRQFGDDWRTDPLSPVVSVDVDLGGEDRPVFVFALLVELGDDLDVEEYPEADIGRLQDNLRARIAASTVDDWDWIVSTGTKAGAASR